MLTQLINKMPVSIRFKLFLTPKPGSDNRLSRMGQTARKLGCATCFRALRQFLLRLPSHGGNKKTTYCRQKKDGFHTFN